MRGSAIGVAVVLLVSFIFPFFVTPNVHATPVGTGTVDDPYQILDCYGLQQMDNARTSHFALANDIDCSATEGWNDGDGFAPIGGTTLGPDDADNVFTGSLDGRGHTISSLYIYRESEPIVGLFGALAGSVKNLYVTGTVVGGAFTGAVAGAQLMEGSIISNVYTDVSVAGIASDSGLGLPIAGVGGITGLNGSGTIRQSASGGQVLAVVGDESMIQTAGGLVGMMLQAAVVMDSFTVAEVVSASDDMVALGGAVGASGLMTGGDLSTIANVYAAGSVSGRDGNVVAGLVGLVQDTAVGNSFSAAELSGTESTAMAGFMGQVGESYVVNNYFDATRTGVSECATEAIEVEGVCTAVNTAEDPDPDYFFGNHINPPLDEWNFDGLWVESDGSYPVLNTVEYAPDEEEPDGDSEETPATDPIETIRDIAKNIDTSAFDSTPSEPIEITLNDFGQYLDGTGYLVESLKVGQIIHFDVDADGATEHHTITIKKIGDGYVILTVASDPFDLSVNQGSASKVVVDGQHIMDVTIVDMTNQSVDLRFKKAAAAPVLPTLPIVASNTKTEPSSGTGNADILWLSIGGVALLALIVGMLFWRRSRYKSLD